MLFDNMYKQIFFRYREHNEYDSLSLRYQRTLLDKLGIYFLLFYCHVFSSVSLKHILLQTLFLHSWHSKGLSSECVVRCILRLPNCVNDWSHSSQLNIFVLVWIFPCTFKALFEWKLLRQRRHLVASIFLSCLKIQ